jgi:AraC family transcriptional activator of pobA
MASSLPLFHLYGDPPDDQAFDFIHVERIASRAPGLDWTIRAHRHRNLFQILLIERGGGEMTFDMAHLPFVAPAAILVPAAIAHGFRFEPNATDGWVISFTEDAAAPLTDRAGDALARMRALAAEPIVPIDDEAESARLSALCRELFDEGSLARGGYRFAMRGLLVLIAVSVARLAAGRERTITVQPADATVAQLRALIDENFHAQRQLGFYADKLSMTVDRLNDRVKQSTGVTAGHLIRQRLLTEAKRQLVFTAQPIHDISKELAFADPSHFARFFRKQTGTTPHEFRDQRGG